MMLRLPRPSRGLPGHGLLLVSLMLPGIAAAQVGEIAGRVLSDSGTRLAGATVAVSTRSARSDDAGRFRLADVPAGRQVLTVRALGFSEVRVEVTIAANEVLVRDFTMERAPQLLPGRVVTADAPSGGKLSGFHERMKSGIGHFITREQFADAEGGRRKTGEILALVPGVSVKRGSSRAWVATGGRAVNPTGGGCAFCRGGAALNRADIAAGARPACYMDVYLDGALVFNSTHPESGLFDVNSVSPEQLDAVEVYTSASQVPAQYNRTAMGCGVLLLWTR